MGEHDENGDGKLSLEEWLKYVKGIFDKKESSCQAILKLYEEQISQIQESQIQEIKRWNAIESARDPTPRWALTLWSPRQPDAKLARDDKVWNVSVEKAPDAKLGLDVVEMSKFLKVKVAKDGLVQEWNKS